MVESIDRSLERHLVAQLLAISTRMAELTEEQRVLQRLLEKVRKGTAPSVDVTRKNSHQRILVETVVIESLTDVEMRSARSLYLDVRHRASDVNPSTFRSYLRRMHQRGILSPIGTRGNWCLNTKAR
jgi:DNA-binding IclR family transcriptional regulator